MAHYSALILGNGPSAAQVNFTEELPFNCFGMNAAYRHWHDINWYPDYYSCLDLVVGISHLEAIRDLVENSSKYGIKRFLLRSNLIDELDGTTCLDKVENFDVLREQANHFLARPVTTGSHTLAWAAFLGYKKIFTIGVDCNYVEIIDGAAKMGGNLLQIEGDPDKNPNYFFDSYQRSGDSFQIPNPSKDLHVDSWRNVGDSLPAKIKVFNANPLSNMDAFQFCTWDEALLKGARPNKFYRFWDVLKSYPRRLVEP